MTYNDYYAWAEQYRNEAAALADKLEKKRKIKFYPTIEERKQGERAIRFFSQMRREALYTAAILENKAKAIEEAERCE